MLRVVAFGLIAIASAASAEDFNWRSHANQVQMSTAFEGAAQACEETFGFTHIPLTDKGKMPDKIDAYLLLRDAPDAEVGKWAALLEPIRAMGAGSSSTEDDDHQAASAAVAAAEDPSLYDEAQKRYLEGALGPFRRALDACSAGAGDPFLGKYYWTGSGSLEHAEKSMRDFFAELVAGLKTEKPRPKHKH
jgi:hypothetical protein